MYLETHETIKEAPLQENTMCIVCRKFLMKESDASCEKHRSHDKSVCVNLGVRQKLDSILVVIRKLDLQQENLKHDKGKSNH